MKKLIRLNLILFSLLFAADRAIAGGIPLPGEPSVLCVCPDNSELGWMPLHLCEPARVSRCGGTTLSTSGNAKTSGGLFGQNQISKLGRETGDAFYSPNSAKANQARFADAEARVNAQSGDENSAEKAFGDSWRFREVVFKLDPPIGEAGFAPPESFSTCDANFTKTSWSVPPGYGMFYNSMYGGQAETTALKIERFPDGRAIFTDASNTRWTFRPYGEISFERGDNYYRSPLGSSSRLVFGDLSNDARGYRVESSDGDVIEFSSGPAENQWRPSRLNAADGSWLTYSYGPNGLARITDMHGRYFAFERNAQGLPVTVADELGKKSTFSYDAAGHATEITFQDGFKKQFGYNQAGMMTSLKNGSLAEEHYTYDSKGRVLTSESEGGVNRLDHYYNDTASKTVITDAYGGKTEYSYINDGGRKLTTGITDALGNKGTLTYDGYYSVATITDQLGRITKYVRNNNGDPEIITDTLGNTATIQYQVKLNYKDDSGEHTDYYSRPIRITDTLGRLTKLDYDSYGNLSEVEDTLGNRTSMDYDNAGHILSLRDALGSVYKYEYDRGLKKSIDPLGRVTKYQRDAESRVTLLTDPLGRNTSFTYDLSGNVTSVTNPLNFVTRFAYGNGACPSCGGSQLSALTDPKGNTWTFGYDQYGRLTNTANPLGQAKTYGYDKMSRVTEVKDPAGNVTAYTFDALNRLTKRDIQSTSGARSVTDYVYDAVGNLLSISNGESNVSYAYDQFNRPVGTKQSFAGNTYGMDYSYDAVGNRTAMTTPWGKYIYTYDAVNRLTSIVNPQGITVSFSYDAAGRRTKKAIFKAVPEILAEADYTYDAAGELLSITNKAGGKVVAFDNYRYDSNGNRVEKQDQNGTTKYGYDASNRLIMAEPVPFDMEKAEGFVYDKNGNRRFDRGAKDYKYDAANRVLNNSVYTYTHDQNGNLITRTEIASSATVTYAYNPEQQLAEVVTPKDKLEFKYDPLGRRTTRTINGAAAHYVYDGQDIIAELDGQGFPINIYTNGPGIDEPMVMAKPEGKNYFYHADALGSITATTDDNRKLVECYTYKSYGQPTIKDTSGQEMEKSSVGNLRMFAAREYEPEIGLYNNRHRYLDPKRGAFTQEDPIGIKSGNINYYVYVFDAASKFVDPFGTDAYIVREYLPWLMHDTVYVSDPKNPGEYYVFSFAPKTGVMEAVSLSGVYVNASVSVSKSKQPPSDFYLPTNPLPSLFPGETFMGIGQKILEFRKEDAVQDQSIIDFGLALSVMESLKYSLYGHNCVDVAKEIYAQGN